MADRFYGLEVGASRDTITQGSSTTSKGIEVRVDLAKVNAGPEKGRNAVILGLEKLIDYIRSSNWTPA